MGTNIGTSIGASIIPWAHAEDVVRELLATAGIATNGHAPHDIRVHDSRFYRRLLADGSLGLGDSYIDGWWDSEALDVTIGKILSAGLREQAKKSWKAVALATLARLSNLQSPGRAFQVGERHYDVGNDLYQTMLDQRMVYTCGYWQDATTLDQAQEAKLDLVCRKIGLQRGMRVLELGCGWGSFAQFAAERYGAEVVGYTVSREQIELGRERCAGLPVDLRLADYRTAQGRYDAVVSIGIMEHIGHKNYRTYMEVVDRCLVPGGVAFVHTIGGNRSMRLIDPWFHKHIFPNAVLPSLTQLCAATEGLLVIEDVHNFGPDYDRTLMAWHDNFVAAWPALQDSATQRARYDDRFYRMWRYYLLACAAGFRVRETQLFQLLLTRVGTPQPPSCRAS